MKAKNSTVMITGANRGIGKEFVEEFLKAGAKRIYLGVRKQESVDRFVLENPKKLVSVRLDVENSGDIDMAAEKAADTNILINNAGVLHQGSLLDERRMEEARHEMEVNYFGALGMTRAFAPVIKRNGGGVIVNIVSIAGLVAMPGIPTYSISKAAMHFLTIESRMEFLKDGINVIGVYPGPVDTDMTRSLGIEKISPALVATETIKAMESGEINVFPCPSLKNIYDILQKKSACHCFGIPEASKFGKIAKAA